MRADSENEPRLVDNRDDLSVGLKFDDEEHLEGELVELTLSSVIVDFGLSTAPYVPLNHPVSLTFASACWGNLVLAKALVAFRTDQNGHRRYRLNFGGDAESRRRLTGKLMKLLLSRRLAFRAVPDQNSPIVVTVKPRPTSESSRYDPFAVSADPFAINEPAHTLVGTLADVSSIGAAVVLGTDADTKLSTVDLIDLELSFPNSAECLRFTGWIRARWLENTGLIRYGVEFDRNLTSEFEAKQNVLSDRVLNRRNGDGPSSSKIHFLSTLSPLERAFYDLANEDEDEKVA